jgi:hypothetical protein
VQQLPPPQQPARQQANASRWPLVLAGTIAVLLVLCIGALGAYAAFGRDRATPTPTPDLAATQAVQAAATGTANAAASGTQAANVAASATTQAQNAANAAATQAASATVAAQATAVVQATAAAQATAATQATAAAQAATANAAATQAAGATAAAQVTAAIQATAAANATATANGIAAQTATAAAQPTAAQPTAAPTKAPTAAPTKAPTAPTSWGPALKPLSDGKAYTDPQQRFSFSVPQDWKQDTSTSSEVAFAPANSAANFNVELESVPDGTTLDAYNTAAEKQLKAQFSDYTLVSLTKVVVDNHAAYKRVSKVTYQGQEIQIEQVYFLNNTTANILTFAALPKNFDGQAATFDGIAGSYKALK